MPKGVYEHRLTGSCNPKWRGGPVTGTCTRCGTTFTAPRWEMKRRKFCGPGCHYAAASRPRGRAAVARHSDGYVFLLAPEHPRANRDGYVFGHILVAEAALGKPLPPRAVVHHVNERRQDNWPTNLVICQDRAYHLLLHNRMRARTRAAEKRTA